ncbi:hypothetical protein NL676_008821 [Syzygium grande]|nr:hypothetical protein NL676_008821 [Syzygium grande]
MWTLTVGSQLSGPHGKARLFSDLTRGALSWCCLLIFVAKSIALGDWPRDVAVLVVLDQNNSDVGGTATEIVWVVVNRWSCAVGRLGHTAKRRSRIGALAGITGSLKPSWRLDKLEHNLQRKLNVTAKNVGCSLVALAMRREQIRSTDLA